MRIIFFWNVTLCSLIVHTVMVGVGRFSETEIKDNVKILSSITEKSIIFETLIGTLISKHGCSSTLSYLDYLNHMLILYGNFNF
jgi:hypothetical protein